MKLFYSGTCSDHALPETCIPERKPDTMYTFYDFKEGNGATMRRFRTYRRHKAKQAKKP